MGLKRYAKRGDYEVAWEIAEEGRHVYNELEDARYMTTTATTTW